VVCAGRKVECKDTSFENAGLVERDGLLSCEFVRLERIVSPSYAFSYNYGILCDARILKKAGHGVESHVDDSNIPRSFFGSIINHEIRVYTCNLCVYSSRAIRSSCTIRIQAT
jgi:hypothetical protein